MLNKAISAVKRALNFKNSENSSEHFKNSAYNKIFEAIQNDTALRIRKELFSDNLIISFDGEQPSKLTDYDITEIMLRLGSQGFQGNLNRKAVEQVVDYVGYLNSYDAPQEWLHSLQWDGTHRIETFLTDICGLENNEYHKAVSSYIWTALVACIENPGSQLDIMPVFVGAQGIGKTTLIRNLVPFTEWYTTINFHMSDTETVLKILGCLVAEYSELVGMNRKDLESIKAFLTEKNYSIRKIYRREYEIIPSRCLFFGTTNSSEFLTDEDNRRFLVVDLGSNIVQISKLKGQIEQYWSEAIGVYRRYGIAHENAQNLAKFENQKFEVISNEQEKVNLWLYREISRINPETGEKEFKKSKPIDWEYLILSDVLKLACNIEFPTKKQRNEIGNLLRKLGYERKRIRINEIKTWVWNKN